MRKTLKLSKQIFIHGLTLVIPLVIIQLLLEVTRNAFLLFMPPIGFALFLFTTYGIQPIIIGAFFTVYTTAKAGKWDSGPTASSSS